jgi:predicted AlkP superfamily phosphohydrolase/phosphomutase
MKYLFILLFLSTSALAQDNLVIMGWDGVGRDAINHLEAANLPNLYSLGNMVEAENITLTATNPGWTQVFTGLTYDQSGVYGNPNNRGSKYVPIDYIEPIPKEKTLVWILKQNGYKIGWYSSKGHLWTNCSNFPLCQLALNRDSGLLVTPFNLGDDYLDALFNPMIAFIEANQANKFMAFLLCDPDYYGHKFGSWSDQYYTEIKRCDNRLGQMIDKLNQLGIRNKTKILVVSDHGFNPNAKHHKSAPASILVTDLPVARRGTLRDIFPTVLDYLGIKIPQGIRGNSLLESEKLWR